MPISESKIRNAQEKAANVIDKEAIQEVFEAIGSLEAEEQAKTSLAAVLEETLVQYALRAVEAAEERNQKTITPEAIALATSSLSFPSTQDDR